MARGWHKMFDFKSCEGINLDSYQENVTGYRLFTLGRYWISKIRLCKKFCNLVSSVLLIGTGVELGLPITY
ncbi:hypothetical protein M5689_015626 [Euphorbia peplus]|nr:hypothetical protein M5689_015626 [Euphorbia peplus]